MMHLECDCIIVRISETLIEEKGNDEDLSFLVEVQASKILCTHWIYTQIN
jgi:hypothetical protein